MRCIRYVRYVRYMRYMRYVRYIHPGWQAGARRAVGYQTIVLLYVLAADVNYGYKVRARYARV